jgi:hypothetical protein
MIVYSNVRWAAVKCNSLVGVDFLPLLRPRLLARKKRVKEKSGMEREREKLKCQNQSFIEWLYFIQA